MVVSLKRGPQYRPQNTIILIMGTPNKVPLILGNPHILNPKAWASVGSMRKTFMFTARFLEAPATYCGISSSGSLERRQLYEIVRSMVRTEGFKSPSSETQRLGCCSRRYGIWVWAASMLTHIPELEALRVRYPAC